MLPPDDCIDTIRLIRAKQGWPRRSRAIAAAAAIELNDVPDASQMMPGRRRHAAAAYAEPPPRQAGPGMIRRCREIHSRRRT